MNMQDLKTKYGTHGVKVVADLVNEVGSEGGTLTQEQLELVGNVLSDVGEAMSHEDA
jgi:hypothetical protein